MYDDVLRGSSHIGARCFLYAGAEVRSRPAAAVSASELPGAPASMRPPKAAMHRRPVQADSVSSSPQPADIHSGSNWQAMTWCAARPQYLQHRPLKPADRRVSRRLLHTMHRANAAPSCECRQPPRNGLSRWLLKAGSSRLPLVDLIAIRTLGRMPVSGHSPAPVIDPQQSVMRVSRRRYSIANSALARDQAGGLLCSARVPRNGLAAHCSSFTSLRRTLHQPDPETLRLLNGRTPPRCQA